MIAKASDLEKSVIAEAGAVRSNFMFFCFSTLWKLVPLQLDVYAKRICAMLPRQPAQLWYVH